MKRREKENWSLIELSEETGLSPRTIRYYISRGLLAGPVVAGRGAVYSRDHIARLRMIRESQSQGAMLSDISRMLAGEHAKADLPTPESWERYQVANDVMVWVRTGASPWRNNRVRKAIGEFAVQIRQEGDHASEDAES
jgi:DNA-binding transcriptional MerR regulator